MTTQQRISLQFAALVLIWSTSFLWIKLLTADITPTWLAVWRLVLGALVISAVALLKRDALPQRSHWPVIAVAAVLGNAMPFAFIHAGEQTIDSGIAAVLIGTMPLATFAFAWVLLKEMLSAKQVGGLALGFFGLIFLVGTDVAAGLGGAWGQLLVVVGAVCYALSATLVRKLGSTSSLCSIAATLWLAALCALPFALMESPTAPLPQSGQTWVALLILGFACTGGAAVLYFSLLGQVSANKFAQINYIIPLLGYVWGLLFMGETLRWQAIVATALIVIGVRAVLNNKQAQS